MTAGTVKLLCDMIKLDQETPKVKHFILISERVHSGFVLHKNLNINPMSPKPSIFQVTMYSNRLNFYVFRILFLEIFLNLCISALGGDVNL